MVISFGPAGLGPVKEVVKNLEEYSKKGIKACEISFTYGVYIKKEEDIKAIRDAAKKFGIRLSIHSQYWVNLNSAEKEKIEMSKKRILSCCEVGEKLGVERVVFHPGYYGKCSREEAYENIKKAVQEIVDEIKRKKWKIKICAETMGKINVFGSAEEILKLVEETGCDFCLDFAHLKARSIGKMQYKEMVEKFKKHKNWHCHFSGIVYGDKGERHHIPTPPKEIKDLLKALEEVKGHDIVIVNESPSPVEDSVKSLKMKK